MAFTDPRTWVTDEIVTSSLLNTHVRDNLKAISHPYDYSPSDVDVANTVTETSLWSKVIAGDDLGANGMLLLDLQGDILHNNAGADTVTIRVKFGGATQLAITDTFNSATNASRFPWKWLVKVENRGATNAQFLSAHFHHWSLNLPPSAVTGIGGVGTNSERVGLVSNTAAIDTTADQTLQVTAQWSAASTNNSFRKRSVVLHLGQN